MTKIDIQLEGFGYDVLVNGDHYLRVYDHTEARELAKELASESCGPVIIRDFTRRCID